MTSIRSDIAGSGGIVPSVCVVIAAYNARATIARAIRSALAEPEVAEVFVIDDCSTDTTVATARAADDGSGRLTVATLTENSGPSAARNFAIAHSHAPLLAILDSDDFFVPGRFAALLAVPEWDFIADNIVFVDDRAADAIDFAIVAARKVAPRQLTATGFVEGCLTHANRYKGELAFLKAVFRRDFLERHSLAYAETLRLAEDFELYTRALMLGARFLIASGCFYVAVERHDSLSAVHTVKDLTNLEAADRMLIADASNDPPLRQQLERHYAQIKRRQRHRALLARKKQVGTLAAFSENLRHPVDLGRTIIDIAGDKIRGLGRKPAQPDRINELRFLLDD